MIFQLPTFDDRALTRYPQGRGVTVRQPVHPGFARFRMNGKLSSWVVGLPLGRLGNSSLPSNSLVGGLNQLRVSRVGLSSSPLPHAPGKIAGCAHLPQSAARSASHRRIMLAGALAALLLMGTNVFAWPVTLNRPLVDLDVACAALGKNTKQVMLMVSARQLGWVFDLALGSRQEVRILASEIARYQGSNCRTPDFTAAVNQIFPDMPPARVGVVSKISGAVIGRQLSLGSDHVLRLVREGWLHAIPGSKCRRGPGGSHQVEFASVVEYLKRSRIA